MAALEDKEYNMLMQFVTEATYDMAPYPAGEVTPNPYMFWKDGAKAPAYALIKRYANFFMSCLMYVFSYPIGSLNANVRWDMKKLACLFISAYAGSCRFGVAIKH